MLEDEGRVKHFVKGAADGNEVGEELVRVVKVVAKDMGMDLSELGSRFVTVEKAQNPPLNLSAPSVHMHNQKRSKFPERQLLESGREIAVRFNLWRELLLLFEKGHSLESQQ